MNDSTGHTEMSCIYMNKHTRLSSLNRDCLGGWTDEQV